MAGWSNVNYQTQACIAGMMLQQQAVEIGGWEELKRGRRRCVPQTLALDTCTARLQVSKTRHI
jgi:hypothetical protein